MLSDYSNTQIAYSRARTHTYGLHAVFLIIQILGWSESLVWIIERETNKIKLFVENAGRQIFPVRLEEDE